MKKKLLAFLLMLTVVASLGMAQGKWRLNPYTGKLEYYESTVGLATLASPSFTGTVKSAGPLQVGSADSITGPTYLIADADNPVWTLGAEPSLIMDGSRCDMFYAKAGSLSTLCYTYATDSLCHTFAAPVDTDLTTCRFPFVMKNGSTYYAFGRHEPPDGLYLWSSTDKLHWTALNGGNRVLIMTGSMTNVGVVVVGTTWHMFIESAGPPVDLYYSYSTLADMNWTTNLTAVPIIVNGSNPEPIYIPDRNAILILHGHDIVTGVISDIRAHYVSLSDDLSLAASYHKAPYFLIFHPGLLTYDPAFVVAGAGKDHNIIIDYFYDQKEIWQTYSDLSLNSFYDSVVGATGTDGGAIVYGPLEVGPFGRSLKTWWNFEDFAGAAPTTTSGFYRFTVSGTGSNSYLGTTTTLRPGVWELATGTTTTGLASLHNMANDALRSFAFGAGVYTIEADVNIPTLSTATETFTVRFGFGDVYNGDHVNGAYFEYYNVGGGTPTPDWYMCTASNSTRTKTDTTVAAVAGAWVRLKAVVNAAGTSVEYFINGTSVGTVTTNIPTGVSRATGIVLHIIKSAGTTARTVNIDWAWLHIELLASR